MIGKLTIIEQVTQEWHTVRLGRFGGTSASLFATNPKNKSDVIGAGLRDAIPKKIAELVEGKDDFISDSMQRGVDLEPEAIGAYEAEYLVSVDPAPYVIYGKYFGVSVDGFIGDDGIIEVKCPLVTNYINYTELEKWPKSHLHQMQWGMWLTGRDKAAYWIYHPKFGGEGFTIEKDPILHEKFEERAAYVAKEMDRLIEKYNIEPVWTS